MRKKLLCTISAVAMLSGLFVVGTALPAQAAPPFDTQNFLPDDTTTFSGTKNVLSDRLDGTDELAHLTNVSTTDTTRVKWFACPSNTVADASTGNSFGGVAGDQARLANCTVVIGEDGTPAAPPGGSPFAPVDEAYETNWNIPGTLDGTTVDILGLACIGAGDDVEGPDRNCAGDIENDVFLDDAASGPADDRTSSGEMALICTKDVDGGPDSGSGDVCEVGGSGAGSASDVAARFEPFPHGSNVPNGGFVIRATTSDDATGVNLVGGPGDAQTDPNQTSDFENTCTLLQTATNFKLWECVVESGDFPENVERFLDIFEIAGAATGAGFCSGTTPTNCGLDVHYVVTIDRTPAEAVLSFTNQFAGATGSPPPNSGCEEDETPDQAETNAVPTGGAVSNENVEGCLNDQFDDDLGAGTAVTFESVGPEGTGFDECSGSLNTGTGAAPRLHDHDGDGRFEHCHATTDAEGKSEANIANFTDFAQTASPGNQDVTFCHDPQFDPAAAPGAQPTGHGCADTGVQDTVRKTWTALPTHVHLVFAEGGAIDPADPCHSGDTFRENRTGDTDELLVCTMDGQDNPATTAQPNGGRLQWFIAPSGGGELTATRFASPPPSETNPNGQENATLEAFRPGNDVITVEVQSDTGGFIDDATVQKRVTQGPDPTPGRARSTVSIRHRAGPHRFVGGVTSPRNSCERNRLVRVRRSDAGPDTLIGSDRTNANGRYRVNHRRTQRRFRYYAQVVRNGNCRGDRSGNTPRVR